MESTLRGDYPGPRSRRPELSSELDSIVMKALELSPGDRFGSIREFSAALKPMAAASRRGDQVKIIQRVAVLREDDELRWRPLASCVDALFCRMRGVRPICGPVPILVEDKRDELQAPATRAGQSIDVMDTLQELGLVNTGRWFTNGG